VTLPKWVNALNPHTHWVVTFQQGDSGPVEHFAFPRHLNAPQVLAACRQLLGPGWRFIERDNDDYELHHAEHEASPLFGNRGGRLCRPSASFVAPSFGNRDITEHDKETAWL
jgi:hypothetical protein